MQEFSGIMRSNLLDKDFELLIKASILSEIVVDGFATDSDYRQDLFNRKKSELRTKFDDFKECMDFLDHADLQFRRRGINKDWGTSEKMLGIIENGLGHEISHGALLLALDLRGMVLNKIDGRKDAFMSISVNTRL